MEPLTLNITLDLDAEMRERYVSYDDEGNATQMRGFAEVVADLAAKQLMVELKADTDRYRTLRQEVATIRSEAVRSFVDTQLRQLLDGEVHRTNGFGEPVGQPTTLRAVIVEEAKRALTDATVTRRGYQAKWTLLQDVVHEQVTKVLAKEFTEEVAAAKAEIRGRVRTATAELLAGAVVQAVTK